MTRPQISLFDDGGEPEETPSGAPGASETPEAEAEAPEAEAPRAEATRTEDDCNDDVLGGSGDLTAISQFPNFPPDDSAVPERAPAPASPASP
ncbi:MAG: hypothetical protein ACR2GQ_07715, partial [Gemmatimonadota bacterium]